MKIIQWLQGQEYVRLSDLINHNHLEKEYNVVFESKQNYYSLFEEAQISWKKTQKNNPGKNEELVPSKKKNMEFCHN